MFGALQEKVQGGTHPPVPYWNRGKGTRHKILQLYLLANARASGLDPEGAHNTASL